ncbi:MAG: hypothetical protein M3R61_10490 [Chloroflexota bacterium]|nr:hypothetical protein [Chloroflexota bacterium]
MTDKETYDRTLDASSPASAVAQPAVPLPNEPYYQLPAPPHNAPRARGLGIALVLVGLLLLAFQRIGSDSAIDGSNSTTLID